MRQFYAFCASLSSLAPLNSSLADDFDLMGRVRLARDDVIMAVCAIWLCVASNRVQADTRLYPLEELTAALYKTVPEN